MEVLTSTTLDRARQIVQHAHAISPSASLLRLEQQLRQGDSNARQLAICVAARPDGQPFAQDGDAGSADEGAILLSEGRRETVDLFDELLGSRVRGFESEPVVVLDGVGDFVGDLDQRGQRGRQSAELRRAQPDVIAGGVSRQLAAARRKHLRPLVEDPTSYDIGVDRVRALSDPLLGVGDSVGPDVGSGIGGLKRLMHLPAARRQVDAGRRLAGGTCPVLGPLNFRPGRPEWAGGAWRSIGDEVTDRGSSIFMLVLSWASPY